MEMIKLLLLVPMHISFESFLNPQHNSRNFKKNDGKIYNSLSTDLPLGPISMSAYIKKHINVDVRLIDFNAEINSLDSFAYNSFYDCCEDFFSNSNFVPDFIGVSSLFSPSFYNFMDCGRASKTIFPDAVVVGGGNIPTNSYKYIYESLDCSYFDALCYGEGEKPLLSLLQAEDPSIFLESSASWITKSKLGS